MDCGKMNDWAAVQLLRRRGKTYDWCKVGNVAVRSEQSSKSNIFSAFGLAAKTVVFTMRTRPLTLHHAILWRGNHCLITSIEELDRNYIKVTTAVVQLVQCQKTRLIPGQGEDELNRPLQDREETISFPAVLTERYQRADRQWPNDMIIGNMLLVVSKHVPLLRAGDVIILPDARKYEVHLAHTTDPYKNECDVVSREDA